MSSSEDLARRIESQAWISAVGGQLRDLEQIAREVRALGGELERLRGIEQRARDMRDTTHDVGDWRIAAEHILGEGL